MGACKWSYGKNGRTPRGGGARINPPIETTRAGMKILTFKDGFDQFYNYTENPSSDDDNFVDGYLKTGIISAVEYPNRIVYDGEIEAKTKKGALGKMSRATGIDWVKPRDKDELESITSSLPRGSDGVSIEWLHDDIWYVAVNKYK